MVSQTNRKVLHLTTHLNIGGITSYIQMTGSSMLRKGHSVSVLCSGGELAEDFAKRGFRVFCAPFRTKSELNPKLWLALPGVISLVKKERFDVMHAHTRVTQVLAHFVSKFTGVPVVTTAHGFFKPRFGRRLFGAWGERVIAISPGVAESLENEHVVSPDRIRVVPNAIDIAASQKKLAEKKPVEIRFEYGIPADRTVLSSISRLVEDKGHAYLIEAVRLLKERSKRPYLILLGNGREREKLLALIEQNGLKDDARIIRSEPDITKILAVTDIFVHPATYREGFGLAIAEAVAAGKPVIATDIPAINTLLKDNENGRVVAPKNAAALADAAAALIDDPAKARALAEAGRAKVFELCSLERMVEGIEQVYEEVL